MMNWLGENLGTLLISLALVAGVIAIVRRLILDKRQGRSSCGCGCAGCPMSGACHRKAEKG